MKRLEFFGFVKILVVFAKQEKSEKCAEIYGKF